MRTVHPGELYRHFKNKLYQIVTVAKHSETGEELVIYQALYGDYGIYARPKEMFLSEVDHEKYPQVEQKYRFEKVIKQEEDDQEAYANPETIIPQETEESCQEGANPLLIRFLDAKGCKEQIQVLKDIKDQLDDRLINDIAVVLDVVIEDGPIEARYRQLRICLETKERFENGRLRH